MEKYRNKFSPIKGIVVFIIFMAIYFVAGPTIRAIQGTLGIPWDTITQLIILFVAILAPIILKQDLRLVFPIKIPKLREIFGTILIWIGTFLIVMTYQFVVYFFQEDRLNVANDLNIDITNVPFIVAVIMVAICEEALHRGFILANFKPIKNKFIIVVCMGIIFGIFHTNIYSFLPTAILGGVLSYIMLETDNMIFPILLHFIHNFITVAIFSLVGADFIVIILKDQILLTMGSFLTIGFFVPILLYLGSRLLKSNKEKN
ncbi:MAG: CPBP family intramembrane metalloprotease [Oscillospiraceae bacterium]|nr:CPBP family intramembrane metalloprotease [Oscillospiraceae bacterium]